MGKGAAAGRMRWIAVFTTLLLVSSAVPVFAAESPAPEGDSGATLLPGPSEEQLERLPSAQAVQEGIEMAEADEKAREQELKSPAAVRQREESRYAFADLNAAEAQELLVSVFPEQLATLNSDPARFLSDAEIIQPLGQSVATVRDDGDTSLLDAGMPVRTIDENGQLSKVDLSLKATSGGFDVANPLTDVSIPDEAGKAIEIGNKGLAVSTVGADGDRAALRFGEKNVFYADVHGAEADTDQIVSPTAAGVEIFDLLRSADSPEVLRFQIDLPEGAELRSDGIGGADAVRGEEHLASIPFPTATDAQGTPVPVDLRVEGDTIALHVAHREADVAYPLLLDPAITEDWYNYNWFNGHNLAPLENGTWVYTETHSWIEAGTSCITTCFGPSGRGLYVGMPSGTHWAQQYGHWSYTTPNSNSYLVNGWANPFVRDDRNCFWKHYPEPHDYVGMWHNGAWNRFLNNMAIQYGYVDIESWGSAFILGLATGGGGAIPCRRDIAAGGVAIWLDDWENPAVDSVTGIPAGWVSDATPITVTVNSHDTGLGVRKVTIYPQEKAIIYDNVGGCTGLAGNRCPTTRATQKTFTGDSLGEGVRFVQVSAEDPTGKGSATYETNTRVDRTPPEVTLSGQLAQATNEGGSEEVPAGKGDQLSLPVYNLKIEAKDGSMSEAKTKRSGVKDIEVFLDGEEQQVSWSPQACPYSSCPMTQTYTLKLINLMSAGKHTLKVKAVDQVGKVRERNIEFEYFPATGMKDEYVMHYFPLPDGQGDEAEEEHPVRPELAVNVMNGNLVYREQDIDVEGPAVDLKVERYYNSQLPDSESTEWGRGWTLAQTPDLKPMDTGGSPSPDEAELLGASGSIEDGLALPTEAEAEKFNPALQATLTKKPSGGYELTDETGESATSIAFSESGRTEALLTEGYAKVDYAYQEGALAEVAVDDPGSAGGGPPEAEPGDPPTYANSFGSKGSGSGQLKSPGDIAVDANGNIWVADRENNRIQKFNAKGEYLTQFGVLGTGDGQLNAPSALAIDAAGNIWVADRGNHRIQKFSPSGQFLSKFGSVGTANGKLASPGGIAIDASGEIWVSDPAKVQKFTQAGEFIERVGTAGSGLGQLSQPKGLDWAPDGNVWIADSQNNRVSVFSEAGQFVKQFGGQGSGDGQFKIPTEVEVDARGHVWVGDRDNHRVQLFNQDGAYIAQFGSSGSGEGQFSFTNPLGIATDDAGGIWITDVKNHRVQKWVIPDYLSTYTDVIYADSFGENGAGGGQLNMPGDVAIDAAGNAWVIDKANDRIQKFNAKGEFVSKFGSSGSGNGQLSIPISLAIDVQGGIWVTERANHRVQKFSPSGEYLAKFGSYGTGNGQFNRPEGIAIDPKGNIWVSDNQNGRVQKFNSNGEFLKVVGSKGSAPGQFGEPKGIDIGPGGKVWIVDWLNNRVSVFNEAGEYLSQFGSAGSGNGQFNRPTAVDVDAEGHVWVGDQNNNRVQLFSQPGQYVDQFGSSGSGEGQFSFAYPMGVATDDAGGIWITDVKNHRVQKWVAGSYVPDVEEELEPNDPSVEVDVSEGLVSAVDGQDAGEHDYQHDGDFLTAHSGPQGETKYEKDSAGRMTKVTLPNGTWGSIAYHADGRVKSVTVDPAGPDPAKATYFDYSDEPRRTTVTPPDAPHITYDIGADGSVLKWWNAQEPPVFDDLAGTLYDNREKSEPISVGDHTLSTQAYSPEGIASVEVIANGTDLVDEKTCEQDLETPGIECETLINEWVTSTDLHAPGHLNLEVLITDRLGQSASERFWVDIPQPPPPLAPGTPVPPTFRDIAKFREEYGLEVVFPVKDEIELNERIFGLIGAWHNPQTPAGEVARVTMDRWGVPLRPVDVAELEFRQAYVEEAGRIIPSWASTHAASTYAGYYVDHRSGGKIHVGFTKNQPESAEALGEANLMAPNRLKSFPSEPQRSYSELLSAQFQIATHASSLPSFTQAPIDVKNNLLKVGTTSSVGSMAEALASLLGSTELTAAFFDAEPPGANSREDRDRLSGRVRAGDRIWRESDERACTAAFGAGLMHHELRGTSVFKHFLLTAGHCGPLNEVFYRERFNPTTKVGEYQTLGKVKRQGIEGDAKVDALAILLQGAADAWAPRQIYLSAKETQPITGIVLPTPGMLVCTSGVTTDKVKCGEVLGPPVPFTYTNVAGLTAYEVPIAIREEPGDSGAPVWQSGTGNVVGLWNAGTQPSFVTTLLPYPVTVESNYGGIDFSPGALAKLGFGPENLSIAR